MKRALWIGLGVLILLGQAAWAEEWTKTYSIKASAELRVETSDANIDVKTWDQNTIEARVITEGWKIGEGGVRIFESQNGDSVDLDVRIPHRGGCVFCFNNRRINIEVRMPRQGKVNLHTGGGHIRLSDFKGDMQLSSGDGHEEIEDVDGTLRAHTGDGRIEASGRFDVLELNTGDGHIEARAKQGSTVQADWTLRTGDGGVTLQVPPSLAANVDLHTNDGHIDVDMPVTVDGRMGEKTIRGKINGGGNRLVIHTGDGSIRLEAV